MLDDDLKLTLSVESFGRKFTAEANADMDIHDFLELCKTMAMAVGYMEGSWNDAILASSAEVGMSERRKDYERDNQRSYSRADIFSPA